MEKNEEPWASLDNFTLKINTPIVVNTDISTGGGFHWIVLIRIAAEPNTLLIIDPLGPNNPWLSSSTADPQEVLRQRAEQFGINRYVNYSKTLQPMDSEHCGQYSILIAKALGFIMKNSPRASLSEIEETLSNTLTGLGMGKKGEPKNENEKALKKVFK